MTSLSDEELIERAVRYRIFQTYGAVIVFLLFIVFMIVIIMLLLQRGDYLYSALIGIAVIIVIFMIRKGIRLAQRYEEALLKTSRDFA